jgi:hypothetical protein
MAYNKSWVELSSLGCTKPTMGTEDDSVEERSCASSFKPSPRMKKRKYTMTDDGSGIKVTVTFNDPKVALKVTYEHDDDILGEKPTSPPSDCGITHSRTPSLPPSSVPQVIQNISSPGRSVLSSLTKDSSTTNLSSSRSEPASSIAESEPASFIAESEPTSSVAESEPASTIATGATKKGAVKFENISVSVNGEEVVVKDVPNSHVLIPKNWLSRLETKAKQLKELTRQV